MLVKPTKEGTRFIPATLAAKKDIKTVGLELKAVNFLGNAADVNNPDDNCEIKGELEPSTANILEGKKLATGTDFRSLDPRALRGE